MRSTFLPLFAVLGAAAILLVGAGLQGVLLPVRGQMEGFATFSIGLLASAYSVGYVAGCFITPRMVRRVGHIRTFGVMAAMAASIILLQLLVISAPAWIALRMVAGLCLAGLMMVIESWLNERATNANRGLVFSVYMVVNLSAVTGGQLLLATSAPEGFRLFVIAGIAIALSLVPISLTRFAAPQPVQQVTVRLGRLYRMSPVGLVGAFTVGLANGAWGGLGPIFAHARGLEAGHVALVMSAAVMGGAISQLPVGRLSDRIDRRRVMIGACIAAIAVALIVGSLPFLTGYALIGAILIYGMAIYPLYGLAVAHTNDFLSPEDFVEASSALLMVYGFGAIIGPMLAAEAMSLLGNGALFYYTALVHLLFIGFVLLRMRRRAAPSVEEKDPFRVTDGAISPQGALLDPRGPGDVESAQEDGPDGTPPSGPDLPPDPPGDEEAKAA